MPGGDGTGPNGMGPMTGRAAGYCAGYGVPGYMNPGGGRPGTGRGFGAGYGRAGGWGGGRGRRNQYYATGLTGWQRTAAGQPAWGAPAVPWNAPTKEQQVELLKNQAGYFQDALDGIRRQIDEIEKQPEGSG